MKHVLALWNVYLLVYLQNNFKFSSDQLQILTTYAQCFSLQNNTTLLWLISSFPSFPIFFFKECKKSNVHMKNFTHFYMFAIFTNFYFLMIVCCKYDIDSKKIYYFSRFVWRAPVLQATEDYIFGINMSSQLQRRNFDF